MHELIDNAVVQALHSSDYPSSGQMQLILALRSLEFVDMSTTALQAGTIVLAVYPLADNACCSQNADASYIIKINVNITID